MSDSIQSFLRGLLNTPEPPPLGPGPRIAREELAVLNARMDGVFHEADLSPETEKLIRALVLLWHDHLENSHSLSQEIHTPDGSYIHGIMHRREPDYGNARYWFHRVGDHPCYRRVGEKVREVSSGAGPELISRLAPKGKLDPFAFIELCEEASGMGEQSAQASFLREAQKIEFESLLDHFTANDQT